MHFFVDADNITSHIVDIVTPIYQSGDQRLKVSVSSHLPITSNIRIDDENETVDRDICEAFFENKVTAQIRYTEQNTFERVSLQSEIYNGQKNFIKKSDRHTKWNRLLTSYMLSYLRFHLHITYRVFDSSTNKFKLSRQKLPVEENNYWLMTLRFISDT